MQPLVMVDGDYSASLDGITLAGDTIVEIKCPYKGLIRRVASCQSFIASCQTAQASEG
jgi:hypothetical protein